MAWISKRDHAAGVTGREDLVSEEVKEEKSFYTYQWVRDGKELFFT